MVGGHIPKDFAGLLIPGVGEHGPEFLPPYLDSGGHCRRACPSRVPSSNAKRSRQEDLQAVSQSPFRANRMLKARTLVVDNGNRHVSERLPAHVARQGTCREIRIVNACTRTTRRHHRTVDKWISSQHRSPGFPIRPQQSAAVTEAPGCQECVRFRGIRLHTDDSAQIYSSFVGSQKEWAPDSIRRPSRQPGNTEAALTAPNANVCEFSAGVH